MRIALGGIESPQEYWQFIESGLKVMSCSRVVICGLARDIGQNCSRAIGNLEDLADLFDSHETIIYENDSIDNTGEMLRDWADESPGRTVISESLGKRRWGAEQDHERTADMATYRNQYLSRVDWGGDHNYVIVVDLDVAGWSLLGLANTFGREGWDFVGSVSLNGSPGWYHYDSWAFRKRGSWRAFEFEEFNGWLPRPGGALEPVNSCFGGLGVYRIEAIANCIYRGGDCEHVLLHRAMQEQGADAFFLNPSQIVVYSQPNGENRAI